MGVALWAVGCRSAGAPPFQPLEPLSTRAAIPPDRADHLARDLATAALTGDESAHVRIERELEALEQERRRADEAPTGLLPYAAALENATLPSTIEYRRASRALLARDDLPPDLRGRLEIEVEDDPLKLANRRIKDSRVQSMGRIFNAVAEPVGRSIMTSALAPYRLARSLVSLALSQHELDELSLQERQALVHWKRYIELHPESPDAADLVRRVEHTQSRWNQTRRDQTLRSAKSALERGSSRRALLLSDRALRYSPEDLEATRIREEARKQVEKWRADRARSLAPPDPGSDIAPEAARPLTLSLLAEPELIAGNANRLSAESPGFEDEAAFALAIRERENGFETVSWDDLEKLAKEDPASSNMARHAAALAHNPEQNPGAAFAAARSLGRRQRTAWIFLGALSNDDSMRGVSLPLRFAAKMPWVIDAITGLPNRLIRFPWIKTWPADFSAAIFARRYLEQNPAGVRASKIGSWLVAFERRRGNAVGALAVATGQPWAGNLAKLRQEAAEQALESAKGARRADLRIALLRGVAREYPGTPAGHSAGELVQKESRQLTPQRIRLSRGFLLENPTLVGVDGLDLKPELLDDEPGNGELHAEGITFVGGRYLEFAFEAPDGDDDEPVRVQREISEERLARLVALVDETSLANALADPDAFAALDSDREHYFERARLGIADDVDRRSTARSEFAYEGMRERYGLVRARESILPVELVIQGSLTDASLGAFPRIRMPKKTPDAFLYK